jgi:hypothetical protein
MGDKSSEETAQRQTVWRQVRNAVTVQMESHVSDLSKITAKKIQEVFLYTCGHLALKPFQTQIHIFKQFST